MAAFSLLHEVAERHVRPIPHLERRRPLPVLLRIVEANRLVLAELIEHQAGCRLTLAVLLTPAECHATGFITVIVEEDETGIGPLPLDRLAADDARMHSVLVRDHQPQRAIRVDDVDALGGDLTEVARRLSLCKRRGGEHDEDQQACTRRRCAGA